jgi:cobalt-zinc-cadmium resistance protein CzcA
VTVLALALVLFVGRSFMPEIDEGAFWNHSTLPPETSLAESNLVGAAMDKVYMSFPEVTQVLRRTGHAESPSGEAEAVNVSETNVNLIPREDMKRPKEVLTQAMRDAIARVPGQSTEFIQPLAMRIEEGLAGTPAAVSVKIFGPDLTQLDSLGEKLQTVIGRVPGVVDLHRDQLAGVPQLQVVFDREAANAKGVTVGDLSEVLETAVGGMPVTTFLRDQRTYEVVQRLPESVRLSPETLGNVLVPTNGGGFVPLNQIAHIQETLGPNVIRRESMSRRLSVDFNVAGRDLGSVVSDVRRALGAVALPPGYYVTYGGQWESAQRAGQTLLAASALALVIIFLLLFMALGSAGEAALILFTLPAALVGGILSLLLLGQTLNVSSGVGFIALLGIAVENGLVLIVQTRQLMDGGATLNAAIHEASIGRLRPKLMTASCAMLGLLPLVLSQGVGSEIEKPLAIVMIGGLVTSTLFTLLVLPVAYVLAFRSRARPTVK